MLHLGHARTSSGSIMASGHCVLENETQRSLLVLKLDEACNKITSELEQEKMKRSKIMEDISKKTSEYEWKNRYRIDDENYVEKCLQKLELLHGPGREIRSLNSQIKSLQRRLKHNFELNAAKEKDILKELLQVEMAKAEANDKEEEERKEKEKEMEEEFESRLRYYSQTPQEYLEDLISYYTDSADRWKADLYSISNGIKLLEKEKGVVEKHMDFLERKLTRLCRRKDEISESLANRTGLSKLA